MARKMRDSGVAVGKNFHAEAQRGRGAEKMKPSGIPWIGEIPEGWEVGRVKNSFYHTKEVVKERAAEFDRLALTLQGVIKRPKEDTNGLQPKEFEGYQILRKNELVFKLIDLQNISTSRVGRSSYDGIVSPAYIILHSRDNSSTAFACYYFLSMWMHNIFQTLGGDAVRSCLNASDLLNVPLLRPPLPEQRAIADYLDEKCGAIDAAIAEAKKGIEECEAWKKSLIFEAVTGKRRVGVFNAEKQSCREAEKMKPSGIPWLGGIPEGWEKCKTLHALCMPITDGPHTTPDLFDDGIPFVSAEAVSCGNGSIDFNHIRGYISEAFYNECCLKYIPKRDDIYMIKSGATTGRVAIVDTDRIFTIWSPLAVFRCNQQRAKPRYLFYYLQSSAYQGQVELAWSFGTQQNIGMRALEELKVVLPPLPEQQAIADYLDEKCAAIDAMVSEKEALIADLEAYKKSLIFELVTGKREVA